MHVSVSVAGAQEIMTPSYVGMKSTEGRAKVLTWINDPVLNSWTEPTEAGNASLPGSIRVEATPGRLRPSPDKEWSPHTAPRSVACSV